MQSCIYEGRVRHTRNFPVLHKFSYRVFMMMLDLDELPTVFRNRWFWSTRRPALARFRREDHIGDPGQSLANSVRAEILQQTGRRYEGRIRLLTNLSYFGYCFNPASFYYCYDKSGAKLEWIVVEVTNTPWGERCCYVIEAGKGLVNGSISADPSKKMHVSPFMPMDVDYSWHFTPPADRVTVFMANSRDGKRIFDAGMTMTRREITGANLAGVLIRYPFMTAKVMAAIHWQALKLWFKRCPVYIHPDKKESVPSHTS